MTSLLAFEWRYQTRQIAFALAAGLFLFFGVILGRNYNSLMMLVNGPYNVVQSMGLLSLVALFPLGVFTAGAMLRDREHGMEELIYATPIGRRPFLAARFAGASLATLAVFAFALLGLCLGPRLPGLDPAQVGAFRVAPYAFAFLVVALPNLLLAGALLFAVAALGRKAVLCHGAALLLYLLYWVGAALTNSPIMAGSTPEAQGGLGLSGLLDPFGLAPFYAQARYWTPYQQNTQLPSLDGVLLGNRLLWAAVAAGVLAFVHRTFPFRLLEGRRLGRKPAAEPGPADAERRDLEALPCTPSASRAFAASLRLDLALLLRNPLLPLFLLVWVAFAAPEAWARVAGGEYGSASYAVPSLLVEDLGRSLAGLGPLLVLFAASELFTRDRELRWSPLLDALPVSGRTIFAARLAVLAVLVGAIIALGIAAGVGVQLLRGGGLRGVGLHASLFLYSGLPLLLFAVACGAVHALAPGKYTGLLLTVGLLILVQKGEALGLEHPLLRPLDLPSVPHSDLDGFGEGARAFLLHGAYGTAFGGLLFLLGGALWRREPGARLGHRLRGLRVGSAAAGFAIVFLATGGLFALRIHQGGGFESRRASLDWRAGYERAYAALAALPQPRPTELTAQVDLDPSARTCRVEGRLRLLNDGAEPLGTVVAMQRRDALDTRLSIEGARVVRDARFGVWRFELGQPLLPGQSVDLAFASTFRGGALPEPDPMLTTNGSLLFGHRIVPALGYRRAYELTRDADRMARGLPARGVKADEGGEDEDAGEGSVVHRRPDWVRTDITVSTSPDQVVVAPGTFMGEWRAQGKRYFRYASARPQSFALAIASARYEIHRARRGGVALEVYAHPGHGRNAAAILEIAGASLERFQAAFGPYPHDTLRLVENTARWPFGGFATPGMILLGERRAFLLQPGTGEVDLLTRRVAHEVGHQWWGHQLAAAPGPGASMLTESLTKYAELLVVDAVRGRGEVERLLALERDRYLRGRTTETEPVLAAAEGQAFLAYGKGALAMWSLRDLLGEEKLNRTLRDLLAEQGAPGTRPTTADLQRHLFAAAEPAQQTLIREWMQQVVLYDLKLDAATWRRRADGRVDLDLRIQAGKRRTHANGGEEALTFEEAIEVGVLSGDEGPEGRVATARPMLRTGLNEVRLVLDAPPGEVVVDPGCLRIETDRRDNRRRVTEVR
ncbi:MAG: hypothetical protein HYZ13_09860 [Acidobacteria bacterium]|nr:hypothetical protein [Acidobacteriota bacterium]